MQKAYLNLAGKYFEVEYTDKGARVTEVTDSELFERQVLNGENVSNLVQNTLSAALQDALKEAKDEIKRSMKSVAFQALGFRDGYGRLEVDHTNGRAGIVGELIKSEVQTAAKAAVSLFIQDNLHSVIEECKVPIREQIKHEINELIRWNRRDQISVTLNALITSITNEELGTIKESLKVSARNALFAPIPAPPPEDLPLLKKKKR